MKSNFIFLGVAIIGFGVWYFLFPGNSSLINSNFNISETADDSSFVSILNYIPGYLILLIGILLGTWVRGLQLRKSLKEYEVNIGKFIRDSFKSVDLYISLFASPIIYGFILSSMGTINTFPFIIFALQTGFSSYVVVDALINKNPLQHELEKEKIIDQKFS